MLGCTRGEVGPPRPFHGSLGVSRRFPLRRRLDHRLVVDVLLGDLPLLFRFLLLHRLLLCLALIQNSDLCLRVVPHQLLGHQYFLHFDSAAVLPHQPRQDLDA